MAYKGCPDAKTLSTLEKSILLLLKSPNTNTKPSRRISEGEPHKSILQEVTTTAILASGWYFGSWAQSFAVLQVSLEATETVTIGSR